jgi:hypothetical protein
MNTWLTEIIKDANERPYNDRELERILVYYAGMPTRLKVAEQIEQLEAELTNSLPAELKRRYPQRNLYTKRLVLDLLESLRHFTVALLAEEPRLFRERWLHHLARVLQELSIDPTEISDVYLIIAERLKAKVGVTNHDLLQPLLDDLFQTLEATPVRSTCPVEAL